MHEMKTDIKWKFLLDFIFFPEIKLYFGLPFFISELKWKFFLLVFVFNFLLRNSSILKTIDTV